MKKQSAYKIKSRQKLQETKPRRKKYHISANFCTLILLLIFATYLLLDFRKAISIEGSWLPSFLQTRMKLKEIELIGNSHLSKEQVLQIAGIKYGDELLQYNLRNMVQTLESTGWISSASIRRLMPSKLQITIVERAPKAIWWHEQLFHKIDERGNIIENSENYEDKGDYIILFGKEAKNKYNDIHDLIFRKNIDKDVVSLVYIGGRRWDLYLTEGLVVKLPEQGYDMALDMLSQILSTEQVKNQVSMIDLRFIPDKIFITRKMDD